MKAGSEPGHTSKGGITPIDLARQNGHHEIVDALRGGNHGATTHSNTAAGSEPTPAAEQNNTWGAYFKGMLSKAWTQSIRTLALTMPKAEEEEGAEEGGEEGGDYKPTAERGAAWGRQGSLGGAGKVSAAHAPRKHKERLNKPIERV